MQLAKSGQRYKKNFIYANILLFFLQKSLSDKGLVFNFLKKYTRACVYQKKVVSLHPILIWQIIGL